MTFSSSSSASFHLFADQNDISETQFLKDAIVNHTKYGSTNHNAGPSQNYRYITHYVDASDTLQGLALKYGCKIETLKKFNKLYSDDNNYLRSRLSLLIPIEISIESTSSNLDSDLSSAQASSSSSSLNGRYPSTAIAHTNSSAKVSTQHHSVSFDHSTNHPTVQNTTKHLKSPNKSISLCDSSQNNRDNNFGAPHESYADFLNRIDSSISKSKTQAEMLSKRNDVHSIEEELSRPSGSKRFSTPRRAVDEVSVLSSTSSTRSSASFPFDESNTPRVTTTLSNNNRRKVKSSLKRFEKSHEEIFEL